MKNQLGYERESKQCSTCGTYFMSVPQRMQHEDRKRCTAPCPDCTRNYPEPCYRHGGPA